MTSFGLICELVADLISSKRPRLQNDLEGPSRLDSLDCHKGIIVYWLNDLQLVL